MVLYNMILTVLTMYILHNLIYFQHDTYQTLYIALPRDDEYLAYLKHLEDTVKNKTKKVRLVGSII